MRTKSHQIAKRIGDVLVARQAKLAVAESVTGGRIQSLLTSVSGASLFFEGGVVTYSLEQKVLLLGVDRQHAESVNCVSETVARQMAIGVATMFRTEFGLAITGYAEPDADYGIDIPQAYMAICQSDLLGPIQGTRGERLLSQDFLRADKIRRPAQRALARKALWQLLSTLEAMGPVH